MTIPLQISFRNLEPTPAIESRIRDYAARLERSCPQIHSCRVVVEARHNRHRKGNVYQVRMDLSVPGEDVVVGRESGLDRSHEDLYVVLRDTFKAARRRIEEQARERRGAVKTHQAAAEGRVVEFFPDREYGFIETRDGRQIYFHRNSVVGRELRRPQIGTLVQFVEEAGEQGPQASTVHVA